MVWNTHAFSHESLTSMQGVENEFFLDNIDESARVGTFPVDDNCDYRASLDDANISDVDVDARDGDGDNHSGLQNEQLNTDEVVGWIIKLGSI
jgi:hypothetical protein